ncbi:hypothetical protein GCM10011390_09920 [Aureimonas endophytica]|uniref:HEPN domain-containing protein n=1 Tax=Aureimonas endophytica TaxID=2027858 RepID=A0A916ZFP8_9HYPH|nr:HEPN domain-containing protein [Aureimonas endophytica]GGD93174.1 hypothetical protein GCM10011390_09920 [Aureimonas endophytica]
MRRDDLRRAAEAKLADAQLLLANGRFANAYYLAGYAIEIGPKACIARQIVAEVIPERGFINGIFSHDLDKLIGLAGLTAELKRRCDGDSDFGSNWIIVTEWHPDARYASIDADMASLMLAAVGSSEHGVFEWIKAYW